MSPVGLYVTKEKTFVYTGKKDTERCRQIYHTTKTGDFPYGSPENNGLN